MINKVEARGLVYEWKGKQVNWCVFGEWTICNQLQRLQSYEGVLNAKPFVVVDDSIIDLKGGGWGFSRWCHATTMRPNTSSYNKLHKRPIY